MNKKQKEVELAKLRDEKKVLAALKKQYEEAAKDVQAKIRIHDDRIKVDMGLDEWDDLDEEKKSIVQSQIYQKKFQEQLKAQIDETVKKLNAGQYDSIEAYLNDTYTTAATGTAYDLHDQGVPLITPIDKKAMLKSVELDPKLSNKLYGSYMNDMKTNIRAEISRGIATADSYEHIARNISNRTNQSFNKTMRIVRTEGHRIQIEAAYEQQQKAKKAGADIVKQWDATLDGRTRPTHRKLDGQIRDIDDYFEVNGHKAKYPSGFGRPEEDINCRCTLLQRARWALDDEELETLKKRAEHFGLDKTDDFNDFKKKYLKAAGETDEAEYQASIKARRAAYKARQTVKNVPPRIEIPDFDKMSHADVVKWADSNLKTTIDVNGANKDFVRETVKAVAVFEDKMGGTIEGMTVKFGGVAGNAYAQYDANTKTLLLKKTGNLAKIEEVKKEENARFMAKWKVNKDYHATTTFSGTVYHELGHAIDHDSGFRLSRNLGADDALYEKAVGVSNYAGSKGGIDSPKASEAWAENFAAYMEGNANADKVPAGVKEMIEGYFKTKKAEKTIENSVKSSKIVAGAVSGARNPFSKEAEEHAERYYGLVRSMKTDVAKISAATGIPEKDVQAVKDFLFYEKHDLGGDEPQLFEPDFMMAESWQRLVDGRPEPHDLTLLRHEIMEKELMAGGMSQEEAHIQTSAKFNYDKEARAYHAEIEKHKKK